MSSIENTLLYHVLNINPEATRQGVVVGVSQIYLDPLDLGILHYIAMGTSRKQFPRLLHSNLRTVESRLQRMRKLFLCADTAQLMATIGLITIMVS